MAIEEISRGCEIFSLQEDNDQIVNVAMADQKPGSEQCDKVFSWLLGRHVWLKSLADCLARHGLAQNLKNAAKGQISLNKIVYLNQIRYGCLMN